MKQTLAVCACALLLSACAQQQKVSRIEPTAQTDLSGRWNDTDSRLVAEEMIRDVLNRPWLQQYVAENSQKPTLIVGRIGNLTSEHISVETFVKDIERELINSGKVRFVASRDEREDVRDERADQQEFASEATMKKWARERGADFMLIGGIKSITDAVEGQKAVFYQTDLELIDIETNEKVWIGSKKIKKLIEQGNVRW